MRSFFVLFASTAPVAVFAQQTGTDPGTFVTQIFNFALGFGGFLAFGMLVYGGVKYMAAAGNSSGQSDAKDQITQALLGLLLLIGGIFILNIINPEITASTFGTLEKLKAVKAPVGGTPCPSTCGGGQGCIIDPTTGNGSCQPCPKWKSDACVSGGEQCVVVGVTFVCAGPCGPKKPGYCPNPTDKCEFIPNLPVPYFCAKDGSSPTQPTAPTAPTSCTTCSYEFVGTGCGAPQAAPCNAPPTPPSPTCTVRKIGPPGCL